MGSKVNHEKRTQYTVIKILLHPTAGQAELMEKTFGCCRYLWNKMLADTEEFYAATDLHFIPTPAKYKKEAPFLTEVDSQALSTVHQNLRKAYLNFFRAPSAFGRPQFKTKRARKDSFTVYCRQYCTGPSIRLSDYGIQMPKLGFIRATVHRKPLHWWSLRFVTISRTASGKYSCSVTFGYDATQPKKIVPTRERTIGLNYSLTRFYVDSNGNSPALSRQLNQSKEKLARMQQKLSRMEFGSKNYLEQQQKIRLLHERMTNQRRDFIHKESRRITNAWDAVCVRDTDLIELSQKLKQGGVMDRGFGRFREHLKYKLERQGKEYIVVDRLSPAAKTCHQCGHVNDKLTSRERVWTCPACGASITREVNTAQNIRDMGLTQFHKQTKETSAA